MIISKGKGIRMKRKFLNIIFLLAVLGLCTACGLSGQDSMSAGRSTNASGPDSSASQVSAKEGQSTADIPKAAGDYYLIVKHDIQNYQITLMDISSAQEICYEYTEGTEFFDKYGNYAMNEEFSEGKLAVITRINRNDTLGAISFTDETWDYEDVRNYSIDAAQNRIDIAGTAYQFDTFMKVFSDGAETGITAVGENDVLNVNGIGRTVYAIVIETGHGTLALTNTGLFEGGWVNLGTKVYARITKNMTMELPEGVYEFTVANDGYGDSGEILIRRDKTTTIDLNDYKGEGPKMCKVTFKVGIKGAVLTINGKEVSYSKPLELRYGVYTLGVYAQGYDAWTKQLVVNSPKAKIEILLSEGDGTQEEAGVQGSAKTETKKDDEGSQKTDKSTSKSSGNKQSSSSSGTRLAGAKAGSRAGSHTGSSGSSESSGSKNSTDSALAGAALGSSLASIITGGDSTDYLDTLSDMIDSLDRLERKRSSSDESQEEQEN